MAAFPGPAWASLHSSPGERLGLAEPGVLCLSQPRLPPAPEPAQRSGFVRDSPGSCLELGVGTACLAYALAGWGAGAPVPTVARTVAEGGKISVPAHPLCLCSWRPGVLGSTQHGWGLRPCWWLRQWGQKSRCPVSCGCGPCRGWTAAGRHVVLAALLLGTPCLNQLAAWCARWGAGAEGWSGILFPCRYPVLGIV